MAKWRRNIDDVRVEKKFSKISSNRFSGRLIRCADIHHKDATFPHDICTIEEIVIFCLLDAESILNEEEIFVHTRACIGSLLTPPLI